MITASRVASSESFDTFRPHADPEFVTFGHFEGEPSSEVTAALQSIAATYGAAFGGGCCCFMVARVLAEACPWLAGEIRCNAQNAGLLEVHSMRLASGG
jgi:hypothetical protein